MNGDNLYFFLPSPPVQSTDPLREITLAAMLPYDLTTLTFAGPTTLST